jgi:hypothetical protein
VNKRKESKRKGKKRSQRKGKKKRRKWNRKDKIELTRSNQEKNIEIRGEKRRGEKPK